MEKYRWEKGEDHILIEKSFSVDLNQPVLIVASSKDLPIQFREQILQSDNAASSQLVESVKNWAEDNGYKLK